MSSYKYGKKEICQMLMEKFDIGSTALDIGACDGKWFDLLSGCFKMDAIEAFKPNIIKYKLLNKYEEVFNIDVCNFDFSKKFYDLIVMGDVLEHLTVEEAQKVVKSAYDACKEFVVAVPYLYKQDDIYDNKYEIHKQPDLTHEKFMQRYPGFVPFWQNKKYCYYIKK